MASELWAFFKPTPAKTGAMFAAGMSVLALAATSEAPPRFSFLAGFALTGSAFFYGAYMLLRSYLPAVFQPAEVGVRSTRGG